MIDLTGIHNHNEFYTHHYLQVLLEGDLKGVISEWRAKEKAEKDYRAPFSLLDALARRYFKIRQEIYAEKDPEQQILLMQDFSEAFVSALGYPFKVDTKTSDELPVIHVLAEVLKPNGAPLLWAINASFRQESEEEFDVLEFFGDFMASEHIFTMDEPPRWLLVVSLDQVALLDRTKWNEKRALRFDLEEIFGRREPSTLQAMAALLHRDHTCPEDGLPLLDTLDENSHKHAFSVSEDLKYALREAIELIGNEAIWYMREVRRKGVFSGEEKLDAEQLSRECLNYMYRLLFLFYIEARPELGYAPMKSDVYAKGYSLESLRALEMVRLNTEESRNGYYLHASIQQLFKMVYEGYSPKDHAGLFTGRDTFSIPPLKSHLFDPERTPLLNQVKFRNHVLQRIVQLMSLSDPKRSGRKKARRGRISYAQLGINQLGAVYEALLSYRGFFAEHDLYEVKPAKEKYDELKQAYFVPKEDLEKYDRDKEWVYDGNEVKMHPKGRFIYRLAGRDRQNSASYYTPEVLTQCLVKYALKELIGDDETGLPADDILHLTVCEPAMGSAAFLNEAVNQLSDAYMRRKQKELGDVLTPDAYAAHRQKVKMFLADNNVFGVDLNPVAVELAEVSLWLNTIHEGGFVPWFGLQLVCGNSLVGARRQVYDVELLTPKTKSDAWYNTPPKDYPLKPETRNPKPESQKMVYHFLLPDPGMADYKDKVVRGLAKEQIKTIKAWNKEFAKPLSTGEVKTLQRLSGIIDTLWAAHAKQMHNIRVRTTDQLTIYGDQGYTTDKVISTRQKDQVLQQELFSEAQRNSSPYRRLKLAMDYWCALWFWPIEEADLLPTRSQYLQDLSLILEGEDYDPSTVNEQQSLFPASMPDQLAAELKDTMGLVDLDRLIAETPRLQTVDDLQSRYRYLHWELEFADLFAYKGGFDLVLGNPPWINMEWNEGGIMGDVEPRYAIQKFNAARLSKLRELILKEHDLLRVYLSVFESTDGIRRFLNANQNYRLLKGQRTNLYKCFMTRSWKWVRSTGVSALITQEGVYNEVNGGLLREQCYPRLRKLFSFRNALMLFDISDTRQFDMHIFAEPNNVDFQCIYSLFHPATIDECIEGKSHTDVPGVKNEDNEWDLRGHHHRIINVSAALLGLFAAIYEASGTLPLRARLSTVHSKQVIEVLRKFAVQSRKLSDFGNKYHSLEMWNETNAQKDETIKQYNHFPKEPRAWVVSGPHFYSATLFYKTPRERYTSNQSYDPIDLTGIPHNYLPRTYYTIACSFEEYAHRLPSVPWDSSRKVTEFYRLTSRRALSQSGERTLITIILPRDCGHIDGVFSVVFKDQKLTAILAGLWASVPFDFYIKSTGKGDIRSSLANQIPVPEDDYDQFVLPRALLLNALTIHYADLWQECWDPVFTTDRWTKDDPRLSNKHFTRLTDTWTWDTPLRTDYARRQALVELDVLAAMALGLTLEELQTIYRVQFPVLRWNDRNTFYDQQGRIVYTVSKGLPGVGFSTKEWNEIKDMKEGTVERTITDDTMPGGPVERVITYYAPFDGVDREADYALAWEVFARRK